MPVEQPKFLEGKRVVLVGVGTMNPGIAVDYLLAGSIVTLLGRNKEKVAAGVKRTAQALDFLLSKGAIDQDRHKNALGKLAGEVQTGDLSRLELLEKAEIVLESITEAVELKQALFKGLEKVVSPQALLLSNTSGLSISEISRGLDYPERVVGTHYWNPAYLMPLVEVTPGQKTNPELVDLVCRMLLEMGKRPIRVKKERPGLIWNRLQLALIRECLYLLEEGVATIEDLDLVVEQGLARRWSLMGPFKTSDLGGQDVFLTIAGYLFPDLSNAKEPPAFWKEMVERGETGLKRGQGFYKWSEEDGSSLLKQRDEYMFNLLFKSLP